MWTRLRSRRVCHKEGEGERGVQGGMFGGGGKCPTFCWGQRIDLSAFHLGFSAKPCHSRSHSISVSLTWYSACKKINHCNISIPGSISEYSFTTILTQRGPASYLKQCGANFLTVDDVLVYESNSFGAVVYVWIFLTPSEYASTSNEANTMHTTVLSASLIRFTRCSYRRRSRLADSRGRRTTHAQNP